MKRSPIRCTPLLRQPSAPPSAVPGCSALAHPRLLCPPVCRLTRRPNNPIVRAINHSRPWHEPLTGARWRGSLREDGVGARAQRDKGNEVTLRMRRRRRRFRLGSGLEREQHLQADGDTRKPLLGRSVLRSGIDLLPQSEVVVSAAGGHTVMSAGHSWTVRHFFCRR